MLGFTQSHSIPIGDVATEQTYDTVNIRGFLQTTPGTYKSENPMIFTGIDKIHLKSTCFNGSIVNGVREPTLYSFVLDKPTGNKIDKEPRIKFIRKVIDCVLSHIAFCLKDDDDKQVDFNGKTISVFSNLVKICFSNPMIFESKKFSN